MVPQKAVLFKGTVAENLRWGDENASEQTLEEALEISQAKEFVDSKPGKLEFYDRTKREKFVRRAETAYDDRKERL